MSTKLSFVLAGLIVVLGVLGGRIGSQAESGPATPSDPVLQLQATAVALQVPVECVVQAFGNPAEPSVSTPAVGTPTALGTSVAIGLVDIGYDPCAVTIPADTPVTIRLVNSGSAVGNFVIDELSVRSELLPAGAATTVSIEAPPGIYTFYSDVPGHREAGQSGVLVAQGASTPTAERPVPATPIS